MVKQCYFIPLSNFDICNPTLDFLLNSSYVYINHINKFKDNLLIKCCKKGNYITLY